MMRNPTVDPSLPASTMPPFAASVAMSAAVLAVVALGLLHVLERDLAPASHMISEYALGASSWLMTVCFAAFATSSASLLIALRPHVRTRVGRIGLGFIFLAAVGLALAAVFPTDPASTQPEDMSFAGRMHGVAFMVGVPGELFGVLLVTLALRRRSLVLLAAMEWLSLALMIVALVLAAPQPGAPAQGWFGIPNRTFMVSYALWLTMAAWAVARNRPGLPPLQEVIPKRGKGCP